MKKQIALIVLTFSLTVSFAQRDPQFSFNMFNHMANNPGFAGASEKICARGIFHKQWIGFEGAPSTVVFSGDMPLKKINSGVGLNIIKDNNGFNSNFYMNANYAYRLNLAEAGDLGLGLGVGFLQNAVDGEWITPDELNSSNGSPSDDPYIPEKESHLAFDLNFGAFYQMAIDKYNQLYAGLSITHLNQPTMTMNSDVKANFFPRTYYLTAGYNYMLPNNLIQLRPSIFIKSDGVTNQYSINVTAMYQQSLWAGISYRFSNDISIMAGTILKDNLHFGIAYEITMNELGSAGSVDVMLKYCFSLSKSQGKTNYRSVRYL